MTSETLRQVFSSDGFHVVSAEKSRNNGFVEFSRAEEAARAVAEFNDAEVNGALLHVRAYTDGGRSDSDVITVVKKGGSSSGGGSSQTRIKGEPGACGAVGCCPFGQRERARARMLPECSLPSPLLSPLSAVENLPSGLSSEDLKGIFESVGGIITEATVRSSNSGPWGVVAFEGPRAREHAERAIREFNGATVNDSEITVQFDVRSGGGARRF